MLAIPSTLQTQFEEYLRNKATSNRLQGDYKKWLRYYLDFCQKYKFSPTHKESLSHFVRKLQEKKQSKNQQGQAVLAIKLYYEVVIKNVPLKKISLSHSDIPPRSLPFNDKKPLYIREVSKSPIQYKNYHDLHSYSEECHD
ncbi:MAG: phage integrase N-terminal SAM-like domain-containing protein [Desulfobacterales bacterium]|nr:phage integrase N-terminal SAM-like domain-containing protein [Desulfobacterales bacterium]